MPMLAAIVAGRVALGFAVAVARPDFSPVRASAIPKYEESFAESLGRHRRCLALLGGITGAADSWLPSAFY